MCVVPGGRVQSGQGILAVDTNSKSQIPRLFRPFKFTSPRMGSDECVEELLMDSQVAAQQGEPETR